MKIKFKIDYRATWGQNLYVCGSVPELGAWDESKALLLSCYNFSKWFGSIDIKDDETSIQYYYLLKDGDIVIRKEWGEPRTVLLEKTKNFYFSDMWREVPQQEFLYTSAFSDSFFAQKFDKKQPQYFEKSILVRVYCPYANKGQEVIMCGESDMLGNWYPAGSLKLTPTGPGEWETVIDAHKINLPLEFKLAVYDKKNKVVMHWEYGENRALRPLNSAMNGQVVKAITFDYRFGWMNWRAAGVAIPVFSLRSEDSFGVGEFSDLKKMVDWAVKTGQKVIQILPINDTTITHTWTDSYPYNAISIYALHPLYLGLKQFPLKDKKLFDKYTKQATTLNNLKEVDYQSVISLKWNYFRDLFNETGQETLNSKDFLLFFQTNREWLFPYACFSYFRDLYKTANYTLWKLFTKYDKEKLEKFVESDSSAKQTVEMLYFIQYLLHIQLLDVKNYAHQKGVVLKGDIPIGISRDSVDAWVEPHLFNLDTQTGAPPDDFSITGQNWGFPTYNWDEMAKDGYKWWTKRFKKMADYFDAYRIDHILGFFRIWEIPLHSVQGLLGYFSPALPYSVDDIRYGGMWFDDYRMTNPYIHEHFLHDFFGNYTQEVIETYLNPISWQRFELKEFCSTQVKIKQLFEGKNDNKSNILRNGLYGLCNEVLFIKDKKEPDKYHPRITAQFTHSYLDLDESTRNAFNRLYDNFFYHRHSDFWRIQAMKKLPVLISSTRMLVCGEDLGMIPDCVPQVMDELQILSLEIQRMPKESTQTFVNLNTIPYRSVCSTSTHDMAPIRAWWKENRVLTQRFYNEILWKQGTAPEECSTELCYQILINHLNSPAMLTILPLQDWLSMDAKIRRPNPDEERINIPADPNHYWRYRMHLTLEELNNQKEFNNKIHFMLSESGR